MTIHELIDLLESADRVEVARINEDRISASDPGWTRTDLPPEALETIVSALKNFAA